MGLDKTSFLLVLFVFLISVTVLSVNTKSVYANPSGTDTWGLLPNQNYVDLSINQACGSGNDNDLDGICNSWEDGTNGPGLHIRISQGGINYSYDLSCNTAATYSTDPTGYSVCPSANHKDVYVEIDAMQGHSISATAIGDVANAFNQSPVTNGDSTTGVHLHVQYGENPSTSSEDTGVHVTSLKVATALWNTNTAPNYGYWVGKENFFGTIAERNTANADHITYCVHSDGTSETWHDCGTAKRQSFHYAMSIHKQYESSTSSGYAEIGGNDFVMSLGALATVGTDEMEADFMHELGHNLGLYHGGVRSPDVNANGKFDATDDNADNCKPNYISIMNYEYEFRSSGAQCRVLDYSNVLLNPLDENNLVDSAVGSDPYPNPVPDPPGGATGTCNNAAHNGQEQPIWYSNPSGAKTPATTGTSPGATVDWNGDGISGATYNQNLNNIPSITGCSSTYKSILIGHNDWTSGDMNYNFRSSALYSSNDNNTADTAFCDNCLYVTEGNQTSTPPQNLQAVAGNAQTSLSWTAPANNGDSPITGYKIYRSITTGTETLLTTIGNVTSHTDIGLTNGVTYFYIVTAINSAGESVNSDEASATPVTIPSAPNTFIDNTSNPSQGTVTFSFHSDMPQSTFECQLDSGGFSTCTSPQSYSGLVPGQHMLQIRAINNGQMDSTPASSSVQVSSPPTDLQYVNIGLVTAVLAITSIILAIVARRR
ncbi:MAG: fibronectin type III domain-containing protein [Thaumarchaeota archaeon]|nr:fibronectin type III domain-containing protein [Nitrososphaerota archaeon]